MKNKEMFALQPGSKVVHKHYGLCNVKEIIPDFGAVVEPETVPGKMLLYQHSGAKYGAPLLETLNTNF